MAHHSALSPEGPARRPATEPIEIPAPHGAPRVRGRGGPGDEEDEAEVVPPHVLLSRRRAPAPGRAAFSVCSGHGRTLKGRDLSHLRDSVLRMTGFIES